MSSSSRLSVLQVCLCVCVRVRVPLHVRVRVRVHVHVRVYVNVHKFTLLHYNLQSARQPRTWAT